MSQSLWLKGSPTLNRVLPHGEEARDIGQWLWEPSIIVGLALLVGAYLYTVGQRHRRHGSDNTASATQVSLFLLGSLVLFLSLASPLDVLSDDYLFSAHMVQHILLGIVVPLLLLLGTPGWLLQSLIEPRAIARVARILTFPVWAFLIFNINFGLWHLPVLYDAALADERVHILQHLTFISAGVINWWPVLSPIRQLPRLSYPLQLIYLTVNCQPGVILGAILVFSRDVLYRTYVDAPRIFAISAHTDQQIAGLIMWIPGNAFYLLVLSIVFLRWMQRGE